MIKDNRNNEQIYGRNDMVMLDPNNKIYGSLGLADNYVMKTEEGKRLILNNPKLGSFGDVLTEINIYGRSEQKRTTGAQLFGYSGDMLPINNRIYLFPLNVGSGEFTCSANTDKTFNNNGAYLFIAGGNLTTSEGISTYGNGVWNGKNRTVESVDGYITILARKNADVNPFEGYEIMVNKGATALPFEPYTGGIPSPSPEYPQEIKSVVNPIVKVSSEDELKVQSVTLNNITLNAIPVQSGGNVTIDGQQYIADYVDVERGKVVRNIENVIFNGAENENWILWNEGDDKKWSFMFLNAVKTFRNESSSKCNRFEFNEDESVDRMFWLCNPSGNPSLQIKNRIIGKDITAFKLWLSDNPVDIIYPLQTQIEEELTTEQIQALKEFVTYYPVTIIENNYNTWMKATYKSIESV